MLFGVINLLIMWDFRVNFSSWDGSVKGWGI